MGVWRCLLFILLSTAFAIAQTAPSGTVFGRVVGPEGEALRGAELRLINLSSGKALSAHTDIAGEFYFSGLPSADYSLSVELEGFAMQRLGPQQVLPDSPLEVTVRLERLARPLTRPQSGLENIALEYGLVREQIAATPALLGAEGRTSVDKLLHLVPGMSPAEALEIDPFSGRAALVSANGTRTSAINYQLDGASNNAQNRVTGAQAANFGPAPEAIETFRVVTHTFSAREGRNAGAVVSPVTRSGGASWHGQGRFFWRPRGGNELETYNGSRDVMRGFAGGGQAGGPLPFLDGLFLFTDGEAWGTRRHHTEISPVLTAAERAGDFSGVPAGEAPVDFETGAPYPEGMLPPSALDPLMQRYLDTFLPLPNLGGNLHQSRQEMDGSGQMLLSRLDYHLRDWSFHLSHLVFRNTVEDGVSEVLRTSPGTIASQRQLSNNVQLWFTHSPSARFHHTARAGLQRLSLNRWQGHREFYDFPAQEFGFRYQEFGANPGSVPDLTLRNNNSLERLRIAPFLFGESAVQTTFQAGEDVEYRRGGWVVRGGALYQRGIWPVSNTENAAGSFVFGPAAFGGARNSAANLLLGVPSQFRIRSPRNLHLRWDELALYAESELRPLRGLQLTLGIRYERQPPAVDTLDRIAAFRPGQESRRFPETIDNLIFPGDIDPGRGNLPRSTVYTGGNNVSPRLGLAFSPPWDNRLSRWLFGESGRSVFRASYGIFYDFGAFAGSSAFSLFRATYPPVTFDNRVTFTSSTGAGSFQAPASRVPADSFLLASVVLHPLVVFDPDFQNARAQHWTFGLQRLIPGRIAVSAIYVATRSDRLMRQRELNVFVRNPLFNFSQIQRMRLYSSLSDVRQFESSGEGQYDGAQLRATRYLSGGLAFDVSYTWSQAFDDGSSAFGDELVTENWAYSAFDRRHQITSSWLYQVNTPQRWPRATAWMDRWNVAGTWRWRSSLPLDIRQTQDPTFSFQAVGRPDQIGRFANLDPGVARTFTLPGGREVSGRFAFDPTAFRPVVPTGFSELRAGTVPRNAYRFRGYQQWDMRLSRLIAAGENVAMEFGIDMLNVFNHKNWDAPFGNVDHPFFGIVRQEGLGRTVQASLRIEF